MVATSGDTGSAAIAALNNRENINYQNLKTEIFFFQIGCFPSSPSNNNHECPPLLLDCLHQNVNVNLICIDPEYQGIPWANNDYKRINRDSQDARGLARISNAATMVTTATTTMR